MKNMQTTKKLELKRWTVFSLPQEQMMAVQGGDESDPILATLPPKATTRP